MYHGRSVHGPCFVWIDRPNTDADHGMERPTSSRRSRWHCPLGEASLFYIRAPPYPGTQIRKTRLIAPLRPLLSPSQVTPRSVLVRMSFPFSSINASISLTPCFCAPRAGCPYSTAFVLLSSLPSKLHLHHLLASSWVLPFCPMSASHSNRVS